MKHLAGYIIVLLAGVLIGAGGVRLIKGNRDMVQDTVIFSFDGSVSQITPAPVKLVMANKEYLRVNVPDTILLKVYEPNDTMGILDDYWATRYYKELLVDNDTVQVELYEEVSSNRVMRRDVDWNVNFPVTESHSPERELFLMGGLGWGSSSPVISGELLLKNKREQIFGGQIGYNDGPFVLAKAGIKF